MSAISCAASVLIKLVDMRWLYFYKVGNDNEMIRSIFRF